MLAMSPSAKRRPCTTLGPVLILLTLLLTLLLLLPLLFPTLSPLTCHLPTHSRSHPPSLPKAKPLPACARPPARRARSFLVVFMGNSGSTAISLDLKNHPAVYTDLLEMVDKHRAHNSSDAIAQTRAHFDKGIALNRVPGFKIRPLHIRADPAAWAALIREYDTRLIWQYRKNTVKSALTSYIKYELGDEANVGGMNKNISMLDRCTMDQGCKHRIDVDVFYTRLRGQLEWADSLTEAVRILDDGRGCVWEAPYEDYLADRDSFVDNLQRFLGIERMHIPQARWKGTGDALCEVIENWDELCNKLYGCVIWQNMLEDPLNGCYCTNYTSGSFNYCKTALEDR